MSAAYKFVFESAEAGPEYVEVLHTTSYDNSRGYGFTVSDEPSRDEDKRDSLPGNYSIPAVASFIVDVPNGNYTVMVTLGDSTANSATTVKAGLGRLMLDNMQTSAGQYIQEAFAVHVDDGQLKLAFSGSVPRVRTLEIAVAAGTPTLFLAGDSTVTDQPSGQFPYAGWGQVISNFFTSNVAISNLARSGRSSKSFIDEGRLEKIWNRIRPADYLFVQFAHNDEKLNAGGTEPFTTYKQFLKVYIDGARQRGAYPVLVAPMHRRFFDDEGNIKNTHGEYIEAMKQLGVAEKVPFIDLAAKSKQLFEALGDEGSKRIFMWTEPNEYARFPEGTRDNTHFQEYGAKEIAKLVVEGIVENQIHPLCSYLR